MPVVKMPNGDLVRFPDDMPKEEIRAKIASKFPELEANSTKAQANAETQSTIDKVKNAARFANPIMGAAQMLGEKFGQSMLQEDNTSVPTPALPNRLGADRVPQELLDAQVAAGRREAYAQKPWHQQAIQAADDTGRLLADGSTFGFADPIAAGLSGNSVSAERYATQAARDRAGSAGVASELAGNVMTGTGLAKSGLTLGGRVVGSGALPTATRALLYGGEGAAYGATDALGHGRDVKEGAKIGAVAGVGGSLAADAIGAGLRTASKKLASSPKIPDLTELKTKAKEAYDAADSAGVIIKPEGMQRLSADIKTQLADFGYDPALQPRVAVVLDRIDKAAAGNTTLKGVDIIRRVADAARKSQDPSERAIGNKIIGSIDDFIDNVPASEVLAGNQMQGASALKQARSLWSRVSKNERLVEAIQSADLRTASTGSGGNIDNATRQNVRKLLEKGRGYTPDEKAAMEEIVRGSFGQNAMRVVSRLDPTKNGLTAMLTIGGSMLNPAVGIPAVAGFGASMGGKAALNKSIENLDLLIRSGGDKQALQALQSSVTQLTGPQREAFARVIMFATSNRAGSQQP